MMRRTGIPGSRLAADTSSATRRPFPGTVNCMSIATSPLQLRAEKARVRLERVIATMKPGFALVALDSEKIIQTNPAFDLMHGETPGATVGRHARSIYAGSQEDKTRQFAKIRGECETGASWEGETCNVRGGSQFFDYSRFNLYREDGHSFLSSIHADVSEQKRIEEEAAQMQTKLLESAKLESLGVLAGGVAHDFNNLLTAILGGASLADNYIPEGNAAKPLIASISSAAQRAANLTNQLLAYSGKGRFVLQPVEVLALAENILELLRLSIPSNVEVKVTREGSIPLVEADSGQIEQVLMNLIINGAEAIGDKPGTVTICGGWREIDPAPAKEDFPLRDLPAGTYVWLEVTDDGCGMDEATLAHVFDPFFTTKFTGRGLGLAAVQGIVRGHRGALRVTSKKGTGTTFTVFLPALNIASSAERKDEARRDLTGSGTVLVVDDEEIVRTSASRTLEHYGYRTLQASNGREAIDLFDKHKGEIVLILLDLTMPVMTGEEALRSLRERSASLPVLLTSGFSEKDATSRFGDSGFAGFLQKPYTARTLGEMAREYAKPPGLEPD